MTSGSERTLEQASTPSASHSLEETLAAADSIGAPRVTLAQGEVVGRYLVLRQLGAGGMGAVYAAYDPELDRKVALKLVRFKDSASADANRTRLLREAQAMARVTHPNVVTVHDVGAHGEQVYLAMEFIEGETLKAWWATRDRTWREILDLFRKAGTGLAAAHAEQLVHRDFKPENVMVARSGRVVVLDFGLARGSEAQTVDENEAPNSSSGGLLGTEVTRAGAMPGTPAYMSPEQFAGSTADALSDQFSFCVSLYEGLYGERPFKGPSAAALAFATSQGRIEDPPGRRVPSWLRAVVLRGLAARSERRWPSMVELLDALDPEARRKRRAGIGIGLLAVGLAVGAFGYLGTRDELCGGASRQLAGIWDDERRAQAEGHAASLQLAWFDQSWKAVSGGLDAYAAVWTATYQDACEATSVRAEQSEQLMDLRMACLARARIELEAATEHLLSLDETGAQRVHTLVDGLPSLARCSDPTALQADVEPPADPEIEHQVAVGRRELAAARASNRMGVETLEPLEAMAVAVERTAYEPLRGEYLVELGRAQQYAGKHEQARATLDQGLSLALTHRQWELAIAALHSLTKITGADLRVPREAMVYARVSQGLAAQREISPFFVRVSDSSMGSALHESGEYDAAIEHYRKALESIPEDKPTERARVLNGLAMSLENQDRLDEAANAYGEVIDLYGRTFGPKHPWLSPIYSNLGNVLMLQDRHEDAEAAHRRALELAEASFEPGHTSIASAHANLGAALAAAGRYDEAERELGLVLEIIGESHPRAPMIHHNLGINALDQEHFEEAEAQFRVALEQFAENLGADHPGTLSLYSALARALDGQERHAEAEPLHRKAVAMALSAHGEDHERVATLRQRLGANLNQQAKHDEALELLELALRLHVEDGRDTERIAKARFELAKALWDSGRDRARARSLAKSARDELGDASPKLAKWIRAWLRTHGEGAVAD